MKTIDTLRVIQIVEQMRANSRAWHDATLAEQARLEQINQDAVRQLNTIMPVPVVYDPDGGTWRVGDVNGPLLYDLY